MKDCLDERMKKLIQCIFVIVVVTLLVIGLKIIYTDYMDKHAQQGLTEVGPKINVLIIADRGLNQEQLFDDVDNGKALLLLWIENNNKRTRQAYTFNTLESLVRLEKNKLGFLDSQDPELQSLYVARFDMENRVLYYTPIRMSRITTIEISRNYLIGEILSDPNNEKNPGGFVLFDNGTQKELRMVKIVETDIETATLERDKKS